MINNLVIYLYLCLRTVQLLCLMCFLYWNCPSRRNTLGNIIITLSKNLEKIPILVLYDYLKLGSIPVYLQKCTLFEMWLVLGSLCPISLLLFFGDVFFSRNLLWKIIMNSSVFVSVANSFFLNTRYAFDDINRARLPYKWHFFYQILALCASHHTLDLQAR